MPKSHAGLQAAYKQAMTMLSEMTAKSFKIDPDVGEFQLVPPESHFSLAVFGPSNSEKSYYVSRFIAKHRLKYEAIVIYTCFLAYKMIHHFAT
jgi:hypothetical protein